MSCVVKDRLFRDTARRLNISPSLLELIAYDYTNRLGGKGFPSDSYILSKIYGESNIISSKEQEELYHKKYCYPVTFDSIDKALRYKEECSQFFNPNAIAVIDTGSSFRVLVNPPVYKEDNKAVILTPLKNEFKGKLIYAQSGTGKSSVADNVNVFDSDFLLGLVIGCSPEAAHFVCSNLTKKQKDDIFSRYNDLIARKIKEGKTILTNNQSLLPIADLIVYNATPQQSNERTNSEDRVGANRFDNIDYHTERLALIEQSIEDNHTDNIKLNSSQYLSTVLLDEPSFRLPRLEKEIPETLTELSATFLKEFDIQVNELSDYDSDLPLFDALHRVINVRDTRDNARGLGYAIAFMMQHDSSVLKIILRNILNLAPIPGLAVFEKFLTDETIEESIQNKTKKVITLPAGVAKAFGRKRVSYYDILNHLKFKDQAIRQLGNEIADNLSAYYNQKPASSIISRAWRVINDFFSKLLNIQSYSAKASVINDITKAIIALDASLIKGSSMLPGKAQETFQLNAEQIMLEHPYEANIIKALSKEGVAISGSFALATLGTVYRPEENPLHDLDFVKANSTKGEIDGIVNKLFPNSKHVRTILNREDKQSSTETYIVMDNPFTIKYDDESGVNLIIDKNNQEVGWFTDTDFHFNDGIKGKMLDFFVGKLTLEESEGVPVKLNDTKILVANKDLIFKAKLSYGRDKDIWDYRKFLPLQDKKVERVAKFTPTILGHGKTGLRLVPVDVVSYYNGLVRSWANGVTYSEIAKLKTSIARYNNTNNTRLFFDLKSWRVVDKIAEFYKEKNELQKAEDYAEYFETQKQLEGEARNLIDYPNLETTSSRGREVIGASISQYITEKITKVGDQRISEKTSEKLLEILDEIAADPNINDYTKSKFIAYSKWKKDSQSVEGKKDATPELVERANKIHEMQYLLQRIYSDHYENEIYNKAKKSIELSSIEADLYNAALENNEILDFYVSLLQDFDDEVVYNDNDWYEYISDAFVARLDNEAIFTYTDSRLGELFDKDGNPKITQTSVLNLVAEKSNDVYTKFDDNFRDTLLEHLKKDDFGEMYKDPKERESLIKLTHALYNYFNRNNIQVLVINKPATEADKDRSAAVSRTLNQAIVYYQNQKGDNPYLVLLHELLHIPTNDSIPFDSMGRYIQDEQLLNYYTAFRVKLATLPEYKKASYAILNAKTYEELDAIPREYRVLYHAASSAGEFISSFISYPEVLKIVKEIKQEDKTLFERLKEWFTDVINALFKNYSSVQPKEVADDITKFLLEAPFEKVNISPEYVSEAEEYNKQLWEGAKPFVSKQLQQSSKKAVEISTVDKNTNSVVQQVVEHLVSMGIPVRFKADMENYLRNSSKEDELFFLGKKARAEAEWTLKKKRPDMSEAEILATLNFLHSLEENKENAAYIKAAIKWVSNASMSLPYDNTKARQVFDAARKKHIDVLKYNTLGELINSPEMLTKEKERPAFNPDEAKTFSNKRTITTEKGRVFTVYDVENTPEGQREVCKAVSAYYTVSPWCLSTFTATGEPTLSAMRYWETYNGLSRKIAFENGKPVAFNSDRESEAIEYSFNGMPVIRFKNSSREEKFGFPLGFKVENAEHWVKEGILFDMYEGWADMDTTFRFTKKGEALIEKREKEAWWDLEDRFAQESLSDNIIGVKPSIDKDTRIASLPMEMFWDEYNAALLQQEQQERIAEAYSNFHIAVHNELMNIIAEELINRGLDPALHSLEARHLAETLANEWGINTFSFNDAELLSLETVGRLSTDLASLAVSRIITPERVSLFRQHFNIRLELALELIRLIELAREQFIQEAELRGYLDELPFYMTSEGEIYGFVSKNGVIYLDETVISPEHPLHEYTHIWDEVVQQKNPALWRRGVELMKQTTLWEDIENSDHYGLKWKNNPNLTPERIENLIASEVHSRFVGEGGANLLDNLAKAKGNEGIIGKLKEWILEFWKELKSTFSEWTPEDLENLTLKDFNHMTVRDFADAVDLYSAPIIEEAQLLKIESLEEALLELKISKRNLAYADYSGKLIAAIDAINDNNSLKLSEVGEISQLVAYWMSDYITDCINDPELLFTNYPEKATLTNGEWTEENKQNDIDKIKSMSRAEVMKFIGIDNIINLCKETVFGQGNPYIYGDEALGIDGNFELMDAAELISKNFDAIMLFASSTFADIERFSIVNTDNGKDIDENVNVDADNYNESNDEADIAETEGDTQEHWQIENRTIEIVTSMSQLMRQHFMHYYELLDTGNVNPDTNEPLYDKVQSKWGINKRINTKQAVASILRWTQGSINIDDMIEKLKEKEKNNPWVSQVITELQDTSGDFDTFLSQFFGVFSKPFQAYSIVIKEEGEFKSIPANQNPALKEAYDSVVLAYKIGLHPLFNQNGINQKTYKDLATINHELLELKQAEFSTLDKDALSEKLLFASHALGYYTVSDLIRPALNSLEQFNQMVDALNYMVISLSKELNNPSYDPFTFNRGNKNGIVGNLNKFLLPITDSLEDTLMPTVFDNGKMYLSYVTPSYITKLFDKFHLDLNRFEQFIKEQYALSEFFSTDGTIKVSSLRNTWLKEIMKLDEKQRNELFKHKVQLSFNKRNYMKNLNSSEYVLSLLAEYFSVSSNATSSKVLAWYKMPIMSNKPSSEFILFYRYTGVAYLETIANGVKSIFDLELSRILTTRMMEAQGITEGTSQYITNFSKNGKKFCFLSFMNDYLEGGKYANDETGKLIRKKLSGKELSLEENATLNNNVKEIIKQYLNTKAQDIYDTWKKQGILESVKTIANIGKSDIEVEEAIKEYVWNDTFAAMNIMLLTVGDIAFYKNAEDLQKRLALLHAPGIRANVEARFKYKGGESRKVSDGKFRTLIINDMDKFISNVMDNIREVFNRKIEAANPSMKASYTTLRDNILKAFEDINISDGQGYSSPTSYRKKAIMFGRWNEQSETIYQKLKSGTYNFSDLLTAFLPLKPFVYSLVMEELGAQDAPINKMPIPTQYKNSEYLLIMADAMLLGEQTSKPNLLRAIYQIMEDSYEKDETKGIDTVQFESTVKSGNKGAINLRQFMDSKAGETLAYNEMNTLMYNEDGSYNEQYVRTLSFNDYNIQQEIPEHFKNHFLAHGSQTRLIIPSDLETVNYLGEPVTYDFKDNGQEKKLSAEEFRQEYELTIADNINESIDLLQQELGIGKYYLSRRDRNIALSKILQREILSNPRYGTDLLVACAVDPETGEFRVPIGDPIQSKRIEQLLNSIIKNRVNKLEIAGGPVVQVSNFGTSKELNIRFKHKNGGILMTREEYEGWEPATHQTYEQYVKENQAGIAYYECFAPIYANDLFLLFADAKGNINIEDIEAVDPELLKLIGYRIPTEDKYSIIPMKIIGFLPREAGDAIMLPHDVVTVTGCDFDIDKMYLMRKEISLAVKYLLQQSEDASLQEIEYLKHNRESVVKYLKNNAIGIAKLTAKEKKTVEAEIKEEFDSDRAFTRRRMENNGATEESILKALSRVDEREERELEKALQKKADIKTDEVIRAFLNNPHVLANDNITKALKKAYLQYMYKTIYDTSGRTYRNNKIVDMTWTVLTHETSVDKMLNCGNFDEQKRMGYLAEALRTTDYSIEELELKTTDELKDLSYKEKNLSFIDSHVQFYKLNAAASVMLGMFAVLKIAHAALEGSDYQIDITEATKYDKPFTVGDFTFIADKMTFDSRYDVAGNLIGKTFACLVAGSADAAKDPVLNLSNINNTTAGVLNAMIRLGVPYKTASLFLSLNIISEALAEYETASLTKPTKLTDIIKAKIATLMEENNLTEDSELFREPLSNEELITGVSARRLARLDAGDLAKIAIKALTMYNRISSIAEALKGPTYATRFNSISNAVGPLIIDNLIMEHKAEQFADCLYTRNEDNLDMGVVLADHPILAAFYQTVDIAKDLFRENPTNSLGFRNVLNIAGKDLSNTLFKDRKLLSQLSDFYQSYLLIAGANPVIDSRKLKDFIRDFPNEFFDENYKEKYPDNLLIQSIKRKMDNKNNRVTLVIDIVGLDESEKQKFKDAWTDLHKENPELSEKLFTYNFFREGVAFSPKTFISLVPVYVRERLFLEDGVSKYARAYTDKPFTNPRIVLDLFVRNNWDNNKLVPLLELKANFNKQGILYVENPEEVESCKNKDYIKILRGDETILLRKVFASNEFAKFEKVAPLGNNGEYLEMSSSDIRTPLEVPKMTVSQIRESLLKETSDAEITNEDENIPTRDEQESLKARLMAYLYKALQTSPQLNTAEKAAAYIEKHLAMSKEEKTVLETKVKYFLALRFQALGIQLNKDQLNNVYKLMC